jgi:hypothetical protein
MSGMNARLSPPLFEPVLALETTPHSPMHEVEHSLRGEGQATRSTTS